jgi:hypothetical protein
MMQVQPPDVAEMPAPRDRALSRLGKPPHALARRQISHRAQERLAARGAWKLRKLRGGPDVFCRFAVARSMSVNRPLAASLPAQVGASVRALTGTDRNGSDQSAGLAKPVTATRSVPAASVTRETDLLPIRDAACTGVPCPPMSPDRQKGLRF